jgi:ribosomal protein S19E (S16A)
VASLAEVVANTTINYGSTENRGKSVKAVAHGGKIIDRLVWEELQDVVYLCTQRCFDQLSAGDESIRPIGFPRGDIQGL